MKGNINFALMVARGLCSAGLFKIFLLCVLYHWPEDDISEAETCWHVKDTFPSCDDGKFIFV